MEFRKLQSRKDIEQAQALLHEVYMEEIGWQPDRENPSQLTIVEREGKKLLIDKYDVHAKWFGVFGKGTLAACWRLCSRVNGLYELEAYHPIPDLLNQNQSLEITRLAIHADYRCSRSILFKLAAGTVRDVKASHQYLFAATQFPNPGKLYLRLGARKMDVAPFKYSVKDEQEVSLLCFDLHDESTLVSRRLNRCPVAAPVAA